MLTEFGECLASDVRVGPFRAMRNSLNIVWMQCPFSTALKISRRGKVNLGWSVARVELMKARPIQCFKCWHFGHVRNNCDSPTDRTGHCFKCGRGGLIIIRTLALAAPIVSSALTTATSRLIGWGPPPVRQWRKGRVGTVRGIGNEGTTGQPELSLGRPEPYGSEHSGVWFRCRVRFGARVGSSVFAVVRKLKRSCRYLCK